MAARGPWAVSFRLAAALCGDSLQGCPTSRNVKKRTPLAWTSTTYTHHRVRQAENWSPVTVLETASTALRSGGLGLLH